MTILRIVLFDTDLPEYVAIWVILPVHIFYQRRAAITLPQHHPLVLQIMLPSVFVQMPVVSRFSERHADWVEIESGDVMFAVKEGGRLLRVQQAAISAIHHLPMHWARIAMLHFIVKQAQNALKQRFKSVLLMLQWIHKILQFVHICLESIYADLFHLLDSINLSYKILYILYLKAKKLL